MSIPIVKLRSEILSPSELPEILLPEEPELCWKRLDLAAARDPSGLCTTGVTRQPNLCLLCDGLCIPTFECFCLQSEIRQR